MFETCCRLPNALKMHCKMFETFISSIKKINLRLPSTPSNLMNKLLNSTKVNTSIALNIAMFNCEQLQFPKFKKSTNLYSVSNNCYRAETPMDSWSKGQKLGSWKSEMEWPHGEISGVYKLCCGGLRGDIFWLNVNSWWNS